nr:uncharacterized protein LOC100184227 [Ciona intestinalis]|eukprot:XP_002127675.1 uncharacterized protein LOC100184227 [Ciona intestinalis]
MNATKFEITPTTTVLSKLNHTEYQEWNLLGQKVWTSESKATWSPNKDVAWYTCEAIHITCIVVAFYILYALVHFRILRKAEVAKTSARLRKGGRWLENLCIMGVLTALLRFGNNQALLFTVDSTSRCSTLLNVSIALYNVTIHPIYTFLWVRLRIFYSNRALKHLYSKTVRFLSWVALLCFICVTMVCMVLLIVDRDNSASGRVCANTNSNDSSTVPANSSRPPHQQGVRVNIMTGLLGGCIQLSFLALFLYPIMDNKLRAVRANHTRGKSVALITLIRRSFVLAGLCILSDVAIALLIKVVYTSHPSAIFAPLAMYDVNLVVNLLCIVMTFRRWRVMLFPWFYTSRCPFAACPSACHHRLQPGSSRTYIVNKKTPVAPLASVESRSQTWDRSTSHFSSRRRREKKLQIPEIREPVPDVGLPVLREISEEKEAEWKSQSLSLQNHKIESELQQYSDTVFQLSYPEFERQRSTSLVLRTENKCSDKKSKTALAASLIAKSKCWMRDNKQNNT